MGKESTRTGDPTPRLHMVASMRARRAAGLPPSRRWGGRKNKILGLLLLRLCFYMYGGFMWAARDLGLGRKFKLGRIILPGTIFSRAYPKWMNSTEFRPISVESQNRAFDTSCALQIILVSIHQCFSQSKNKLLAMSSKAMPPPSHQEMLWCCKAIRTLFYPASCVEALFDTSLP